MIGILLEFTCFTNTKAIIEPQEKTILFSYEVDQSLSEIDQATCTELKEQNCDITITIRNQQFYAQFYYSATISDITLEPGENVDFNELKQTSIATYSMHFEESDNELSSAIEKLVYREFNHGDCVYDLRAEFDSKSIEINYIYNSRCVLESDDSVELIIAIDENEYTYVTTISGIESKKFINITCEDIIIDNLKSACYASLLLIEEVPTTKVIVSALVGHELQKTLSVPNELDSTESELVVELPVTQEINYPISSIESASEDCFSYVKFVVMKEYIEILAEKGPQVLCNEFLHEGELFKLEIFVSELADLSGRTTLFEELSNTFSFDWNKMLISCSTQEFEDLTLEQCQENMDALLEYKPNSSVQIAVLSYNEESEFLEAIKFSGSFVIYDYIEASVSIESERLVITMALNPLGVKIFEKSTESINFKLCKSHELFLMNECFYEDSIACNFPSDDNKYVFSITTKEKRTILNNVHKEWFGFVESKAFSVVVSTVELNLAREELWQAYLVIPVILIICIIYVIYSYFTERKRNLKTEEPEMVFNELKMD